jgi:hypothetical protein
MPGRADVYRRAGAADVGRDMTITRGSVPGICRVASAVRLTAASALRLIAGSASLALIAVAGLGVAVVRAQAAAGPAGEVRTVYRSVLSAEYFGPASAVCGRLSARGRASFSAGGQRSCTQAFAAEQHVLRHPIAGVDDSGYSPAQWRQVVDRVMGRLTVTVHGSRASAIGPSGIPGQTDLVKAGGRWVFTGYPPSIEP